MKTANIIYRQAKQNGVHLESTCVGVSEFEWQKLMKGATRADKKIVTSYAIECGLISKLDTKLRNPYNCYKTKTHLIYVHSGVEYFLRIN